MNGLHRTRAFNVLLHLSTHQQGATVEVTMNNLMLTHRVVRALESGREYGGASRVATPDGPKDTIHAVVFALRTRKLRHVAPAVPLLGEVIVSDQLDREPLPDRVSACGVIINLLCLGSDFFGGVGEEVG
mmetsp:Transcript_25577/g.77653  ORF Transcript_25577/g.77653 Transcript_25577/m.77653 type:complete len:130 (+) Transcript_25577:637-1026(+)